MKIRDNKQYKKALQDVYALMNKSEQNLTAKETQTLAELAKEIEYYEDVILQLMPINITLETLVASKMAELEITQVKLAKMLGIDAAKLSQILNNKRKPDVPFLKAIHEKLGLDGNLILEHV